MGEFNIAPNTQVGRIEIPQPIYENENAYNIPAEKYSRGGEFIENMVTDNFIEFCARWFHLADFEEILHDIDEFYLRYTGIGKFGNLVSAGFGNGISPITLTQKTPQCPIEFGPKEPIVPITITTRRDPKLNYNDLSSTSDEEES